MTGLVTAWRQQRLGGDRLDARFELPPLVPPPELEAIIDKTDERSNAQNPKGPPWRPLVCLQIFVDRGDRNYAVGSGVLIDDDVILTAAHNFWRLADQPNRGRPVFAAAGHIGVEGGVSELSARIASFHVPDAYKASTATSNQQFMHDFAIARLADKSLGQWAGTKFDVLTYAPLDADRVRKATLTVAGYPRDSKKDPLVLKFATGVPLRVDEADNAIRYKMDSMPGQSGGPVFQYHTNNTVYFAGVHVCAEGPGATPTNNRARRFDAAMQEQIRAWLGKPAGGQAIA